MSQADEIIQLLLTADEPDYALARRLDAEAIPTLLTLATGKAADAARAVWIASLVPDPSAVDVIEVAAEHSDPMVRAAAGAAARNMPGASTRVVPKLLDDSDPGVRKQALRSASHAYEALLERVALNDPEAFLRDAATEALQTRFKP